jgi:C-terminal processing protease CtpA/Prc
MIKRFLGIAVVGLTILVCGCSDGNRASNNDTSFTASDKAYLFTLFQTEYLWYDEVNTSADVSSFDTPQEMIDALRSPRDRWSFAIDKKTYENYAAQSYEGFGIVYDALTFRIRYVLLGSPAQGKLFRGDVITQINNQPVTAENLKKAASRLGETATFVVSRKGEAVEVNVVPDVYKRKAVDLKIIVSGEKNIGYLRYDAFTEDSYNELENAFDIFKMARIDALVVDLRYNSGGLITIASLLLDNITNRFPGRPQMHLVWNDKQRDHDETYRFEDAEEQDGNELSLERVYFLTSYTTASAAEDVIWALVPYLGRENVVVVGERTRGKNVGMRGKAHGDYYYFLINFYVWNADNETFDDEGIEPTCFAEDDIEHQLGDPQERLLSTALFYMETGRCE